MILSVITIIALAVAIMFLIILIVKPKPVENFSFFRFDGTLKTKVNEINEEQRKINIQNNLTERDIKKRYTLDKIAEEVNKFETVLNFIRENINNIPVCREIDLRPDLKPDCSTFDVKSCSLNNFCTVKDEKCTNKELNDECKDIFAKDADGKLSGKPSKMFVYPSVLEAIE